MLKVDDLNIIIKHFAAQIYTHIEQLQKQNTSSKLKVITLGTQQSEKPQQNLQQKIGQILNRYQNYHPINEIQVQYTRKLIQRVQQIFGFYKWKCRNQSILSHAQRQLSSKLNILINETIIDVGKIMNYIVDISKRGFVRLRNTYHQGTNQNNNNNNNSNNNNYTPKSTTIITTTSKSKRRLYSKSESRQIKQNHTTHQLINTTNTNNNNIQISQLNKRRTASVMCYSLSNNIHPTVQIIDKLYYGMNIDKVYLSKCIDSQNYLTRDQIKRNKSMFKKVQLIDGIINKEKEKDKNIYGSNRKIKTEVCDIFDNKNILTQLKMNNMKYNQNGSGCVNGVNARNQWMECDKPTPVLNLGIFGKKWSKVKTVCKKRNQEKRRSNIQNNYM